MTWQPSLKFFFVRSKAKNVDLWPPVISGHATVEMINQGSLTTLGAETFANFANFAQIRESLRREKFYIDPFAKVYAREIFQFFLFFSKLMAALDNA